MPDESSESQAPMEMASVLFADIVGFSLNPMEKHGVSWWRGEEGGTLDLTVLKWKRARNKALVLWCARAARTTDLLVRSQTLYPT